MSVKQQNRRYNILLGQDNNALIWLIIINAVVFIFINFTKIVYYLSFDTPMESIQNFHLQITDAVVVARYLGATFVLPDIRGNELGNKRYVSLIRWEFSISLR